MTTDHLPDVTKMVKEPVPVVVLWHRPTGRHKWRVIGAMPTGPEALRLMDGHHGGCWMLIDDGHDPNTKPDEAQS